MSSPSLKMVRKLVFVLDWPSRGLDESPLACAAEAAAAAAAFVAWGLVWKASRTLSSRAWLESDLALLMPSPSFVITSKVLSTLIMPFFFSLAWEGPALTWPLPPLPNPPSTLGPLVKLDFLFVCT